MGDPSTTPRRRSFKFIHNRLFCCTSWNDDVTRPGGWWRLFWVIGFKWTDISDHRAVLFSERYGYGTFLVWRGKWLIQPLRDGWAPEVDA